MDEELWGNIDRVATRSICAAFQGGLGAADDTRQLALKLAVGRMLHHALEVMEAAGGETGEQPWAAIDNHPASLDAVPPKMLLYSGHDWTIMPLLMVLRPSFGVTEEDADWADFASDLAFEVWTEERATVVAVAAPKPEIYCRILYCGRVLELPPSAGRQDGLCTVAALRAWLGGRGLLISDVNDWNTLCGQK